MTYWINFLHLYQPPYQSREILDKVVRESYKSILSIVKKIPKARMTLNISGSLVEHLNATKHEDIVNGFKQLFEKKQIELTGSACYHPILPLLPESEIVRQISLNTRILKKAFGEDFQPKGFFLPEMAYSHKVGKIVKKMGFKWILLDEISYNGKLNSVQFQKKYKIKKVGLFVIFRNRDISKTYVPKTVLDLIQSTSVPPVIVSATDGEMYGHHHKNGEALFTFAIHDDRVTMNTVSEYLSLLPERSEMISPLTASWETSPLELEHHLPFILWDDPKNRIHQLLWKLRRLAIRIVNHNTHSPNYEWARYHLDRGF